MSHSGTQRASLCPHLPGHLGLLSMPLSHRLPVSPAVAVPRHRTADVGWVRDAGITVILAGPPARAVLLPHVSQ